MEKKICGGSKPRMDVGNVKGNLLGGRFAGVGTDENGKRGVWNQE